MRHSTRTQIPIGFLGLALLASLPAWAEEPATPQKSVTEQVLDLLRQQGTIDDAKYEELKRQAEEERRQQQAPAQVEEVAPPAPIAATTPDPEGWKVYFKDYLRIERNDGKYKLHVGGMTQFDILGVTEQQDLQDEGFDNQGIGTDFRRARLSADGELGEHLIFKAEYDFADGDADFADVWIGMQRLPWVGRVQAGHFKEPMSLEEITSDRFITFMERALPVLAFAPARNSGIGFSNTAFEQRLTWAVGGFQDTNDFGEDFTEDSNYDVTARVTGLPVWEEEGAKLVHVGYSYSHRFRDGETIDFDPRPEVNPSDPIVDTGDIETDGVNVFGAELAGVYGSFSVQGEFLDALVDREGGGDRNFYGMYAAVSWFITGEHRAYDPRVGAFARTSPKNPFSISNGTWGALELAARYSHVDLNDDSTRGGIENNVTTGVNWYLFSNFRVMLNWVYANRNGVGNQNAVMSRFSLDF